jgi:hypothetical protein
VEEFNWGYTTFTAPDGVKVTVFYLRRDDHDLAVAAFKQELSLSSKIATRAKKVNKAGRVVGDRAQITVPGAKPGISLEAVVWTDGSSFHEIVSSSLVDVLELERLYGY